VCITSILQCGRISKALRTMDEMLGTGINIKFLKSKLGHCTLMNNRFILSVYDTYMSYILFVSIVR